MKPRRTPASKLALLVGLASVLGLAGPAAAQDWLPDDVVLDERGMPVNPTLGDLSLVLPAMAPMFSGELMAGERYAVAGALTMAVGIAFQPSFNQMLAGEWRPGLARSLGRLSALSLGGMGYYQMLHGPADQRGGWAVMFQLTGAMFGAFVLWDLLDPPEDPGPGLLGEGSTISLLPLIMAPQSTEQDASPVLGLAVAARF